MRRLIITFYSSLKILGGPFVNEVTLWNRNSVHSIFESVIRLGIFRKLLIGGEMLLIWLGLILLIRYSKQLSLVLSVTIRNRGLSDICRAINSSNLWTFVPESAVTALIV